MLLGFPFSNALAKYRPSERTVPIFAILLVLSLRGLKGFGFCIVGNQIFRDIETIITVTNKFVIERSTILAVGKPTSRMALSYVVSGDDRRIVRCRSSGELKNKFSHYLYFLWKINLFTKISSIPITWLKCSGTSALSPEQKKKETSDRADS